MLTDSSRRENQPIRPTRQQLAGWTRPVELLLQAMPSHDSHPTFIHPNIRFLRESLLSPSSSNGPSFSFLQTNRKEFNSGLLRELALARECTIIIRFHMLVNAGAAPLRYPTSLCEQRTNLLSVYHGLLFFI